MNKILSLSMMLGAAVLFTACAGEEDDLFDKSAAERLNEMSTIYSARLEAQPAGWAMQYYPSDEDYGCLILADFDANHSVKVAMNNYFTDNTYMEDVSVWDVITDNGPVLSFNTYNDLLHIFSDPSGYWGGDTGTGIGGDYEFVIVDAPEDASYMMLKGKKRGAYTLLTPLEPSTDFETYLNDVNTFQANYLSPTGPNQLLLRRTADGEVKSTYDFVLYDYGEGVRSLITEEGKDAVTYGEVCPFLTTKRAGKYYIRFRGEVEVGDGETVREFVYDEAADKFVSTGETTCEIVGTPAWQFLAETWANGNEWVISKEGVNSEKATELINTASATLTKVNKNYLIENIKLLEGEEEGYCELNFLFVKQKAGQSEPKEKVRYKYAYQLADGQLTLHFVESLDVRSENIKSRDGVSQMFDAFEGTFTVSPYITELNLSQMKLTSTTDPSLWFVINY